MFSLVPFSRNSIIGNDVTNLRKLLDSFWEDNGLMRTFDEFGAFKTDVKETEKEYILEAELAGVTKERINLKVEDETLTISVNSNEEKNSQENNYIRRERRSGSFSRKFRLEGIKDDEISANYENGILKVVLPKDDEKKERVRNIDIQ